MAFLVLVPSSVMSQSLSESRVGSQVCGTGSGFPGLGAGLGDFSSLGAAWKHTGHNKNTFDKSLPSLPSDIYPSCTDPLRHDQSCLFHSSPICILNLVQVGSQYGTPLKRRHVSVVGRKTSKVCFPLCPSYSLKFQGMFLGFPSDCLVKLRSCCEVVKESGFPSAVYPVHTAQKSRCVESPPIGGKDNGNFFSSQLFIRCIGVQCLPLKIGHIIRVSPLVRVSVPELIKE